MTTSTGWAETTNSMAAKGGDWLDAGSKKELTDLGPDDGSQNDFSAWQWSIDGTSQDDIQQRSSPSCAFLSSLASVALHNSTDVRGHTLDQKIRYMGNYQYAVLLFDGTTCDFTTRDNLTARTPISTHSRKHGENSDNSLPAGRYPDAGR